MERREIEWTGFYWMPTCVQMRKRPGAQQRKNHSYIKAQEQLKERLELFTVENFGPGGSKDKVIKIK